jgi:hypothetical protein
MLNFLCHSGTSDIFLSEIPALLSSIQKDAFLFDRPRTGPNESKTNSSTFKVEEKTF